MFQIVIGCVWEKVKECMQCVKWRVLYGRGRRLEEEEERIEMIPYVRERCSLDECVYVDRMNGRTDCAVQVENLSSSVL